MIQLIEQILRPAMTLSRKAASLAPQRRNLSPESYGRGCLQPKFASSVVLGFFCLASGMLLEGGCRASKTVEPRDQELISTFRAHRQAFDQLQEMAAEDARRNWYLGASDPSKLDQSRRDGYKKLTSEIRPELQAAMNGTTGVIRFIFARQGVAIGPGWVGQTGDRRDVPHFLSPLIQQN
jgi:hypothetical protein